MGFDDLCNTGLVLELGLSSSIGKNKSKTQSASQKTDLMGKIHEPSLTLSLSGETYLVKKVDPDHNNNHGNHTCDLYRQDSASTSCFSNVSVKRERDVDIERVCSRRIGDELDDDGSNGRKKLRLNKVQSLLLEESFKKHSTLNPKQKQDLARELKLRPRQVEVWFQNRRARTKLKQTEVDCEFLKKCCDNLTEENRRLQKELHELKALKISQPLYMQLPAATLTMCPSCERVGATAGSENAAKLPLAMASKPHFYNHFTNSSTAC